MSTGSVGGRRLPGSITVEVEGNRRVLCLSGDLDSAVVALFTAQQGREPVVVDAIDAGAVTFIGSSGLATILRCWEASVAAGRRPPLRASSPRVDRLLELSSLNGLLERPEPADDGTDDPPEPGSSGW